MQATQCMYITYSLLLNTPLPPAARGSVMPSSPQQALDDQQALWAGHVAPCSKRAEKHWLSCKHAGMLT
jgi:hypothetical protein